MEFVDSIVLSALARLFGAEIGNLPPTQMTKGQVRRPKRKVARAIVASANPMPGADMAPRSFYSKGAARRRHKAQQAWVKKARSFIDEETRATIHVEVEGGRR